jgi:hypothetical protein
MAHRISARILWPAALAALLFLHPRTGRAGGDASDTGLANALGRVGSQFGWSVRLTPPDPITPPDPNKDLLALDVLTSDRPDLDQQVTFVHQEDIHGQINPCIKVLHYVRGDGMHERVDIVGVEDTVEITVPANYQLIRTATGYQLAPVPQ